jgi:hypothetical protein
MSLLSDTNNQPKATLLALWKAAHSSGAQEAESLSFWQHYLSKHEFKEEYWICDAEIRPEPGSQRRVDRGVRFLSTANEIVVLCWHEAKGGTSLREIRECEQQALDACKRSLASHRWQRHVYALTTARTKAKAWSYDRNDEELAPLFEDEYIEANSNEGYKISKCFQKMKSLIPAEVAGNPGLTRVTQTSSILPGPHETPQAAATPYALFPRPSTTATSQQTSTRSSVATPPAPSNIKDKCREVKAKRDPKNRQALQISTREGWKSVEGWKTYQEDQKVILYSDNANIWIYAESVED